MPEKSESKKAAAHTTTKTKSTKNSLSDLERGKFLLELYQKALLLSEKELNDYFIDHAVNLTQSKIGFFHLISEDQKSIILTAWNGEALKNCVANYSTHYPIESAGNWVDCVRLKRPVIYNDFAKSPNQKGFPSGHVLVKRFMSIPIFEKDKVAIVFGVGNKADPYTENDVVQLQLIANELSKIYKQRQAEYTIRESEKKYRSLFENMLDGFAYCRMIFDEKCKPVDFEYLEINNAFEQLTGLKRKAVLGKKVTETIPGVEKANPELFEIYGRVAVTCQEEKFEMFFKPLSKWFSIAVYCPQKGYFAAIFEDITERKKMQQELSRSLEETQLRKFEISALLKASRAVLQNKSFPDSARAIFDACKDLIGATAGYVALLSDDGKENEVLFLDSGGLPCTVDPSLPMPIRGLRAEAYRSGKVALENDFPYSKWQKFSPEGHVQLQNVLFAPLLIEQQVVGVIGLANKSGGFTKRDSEMAMAFGEIASVALANSKMLEMLEENEKELKLHSEHLEGLVEERTKQLKDSERLAAIGQTAGMVGHDIRNPLQAMTGDVYLAKMELVAIPENEGKKNALENLREIEKNIDYINKIVADLQDFARPLNPHPEETDLKLIIYELLAKNGLPENVKVSVKLDSEVAKVKADSTFISRIMYNLVTNSVQAMPEGGKLTIRVYKQANDVVITVKDTGVGIPEKVKSKMFTPMFTTKSKGQGFGLPVIKRMTEALGGTVTFESQEGKGTTFKVSLPLNN